LTRLQALAGRQEDARASLRELQRDAASRRVRLSARDLGYIHLSMGDEAAALDAFEEAVAERDPSLVWIGVDPRLDPLRANPRFQAILQRMKLP
jgi:tetratricopeptide (TPR) repeat protein